MKLFIPALLLFLFLPAFKKVYAQKLAALPYTNGIVYPIDLKNCGDDRLFVAERAGRIRVIDSNGTLRVTPFLDITSKISSTISEEGFLGIAFSPDYKISGKFYVDYTSTIAGQLTSVIQEYKRSAADSNVADMSTELTILTQAQPFSNHNGGNLMFGKDGYLYINIGDGGSAGDPFGNGQNKKVFLAKILKIDVSNSSIAHPYSIPSTNPFYNDTTAGIKKEIWAYGVRNPWKSSVDRLSGDIWIADVGQNAVEEIDYQPADAPGGRNYGWNITEGNSCYQPATGCNKSGITLPIYDYPHPVGFSVTGGYVYRSAQSKSLFGTYVYADFVSKWIDGIRQINGVLSGQVIHFITAAESPGNPISFGEDKYGDQYIIVNANGTLYKLEDTSSVRKPKAYFTSIDQGSTIFLLEGLQGKNLTYQWLKDNVAIPGATLPNYTTAETGSYTLEVTNALHFKDTSDVFIVGSSVNITSFAAQKLSNNIISLLWKTSSELNIPGYTIQRRKDNETIFSDIGFIESKATSGSSNVELDYSFNDSTVTVYSKLFYRLEIAHTDGSVSYSDIRFISADETTNGYLLFPNPAKGHTEVYRNNYIRPALMILYDSNGKKISQQTLVNQHTTIQLPASKGLYIIQLSDTDGKNKIRKKLLVQ